MFAIGEAKSIVLNGKVSIPKEYRLKKKNAMGKWKDNKTLYLSDSENALNYMAGRDGDIFMVNVDVEDRLKVPKGHESEVVIIRGCVATIELLFGKVEGGQSGF